MPSPATVPEGHFVEYSAGPPRSDGCPHLFCGPHHISGAACPNCEKPLLRFLSLDTRDEALRALVAVRNLPLLFCWTCNISQDEFFYRLAGESVEIVRCGESGAQTEFPYEDYPIYFPGGTARLTRLSIEEQGIIYSLNGGYVDEWDARERCPSVCQPRHQVGGEPYLVQGKHELACAGCGEAMPFLASIADDCLDPRGFTGNPYVQVRYHYCASCGVVGAYQVCD